MLKVNASVSGLKELQKEIDRVQNLIKMKSDNGFNKYLQDKFMEVATRVTNERLVGGTTNDMAIQKYKSSHHIIPDENGFILYNDCTIGADTSMPDKYPNGEFSIALAFEYGVGIVGEGTYDGKYFTPWDYNVNGYNFGWVYPTENGENGYDTTYGYMGFEIYRYIAEEINNNLAKWYDEYYRKVV